MHRLHCTFSCKNLIKCISIEYFRRKWIQIVIHELATCFFKRLYTYIIQFKMRMLVQYSKKRFSQIILFTKKRKKGRGEREEEKKLTLVWSVIQKDSITVHLLKRHQAPRTLAFPHLLSSPKLCLSLSLSSPCSILGLQIFQRSPGFDIRCPDRILRQAHMHILRAVSHGPGYTCTFRDFPPSAQTYKSIIARRCSRGPWRGWSLEEQEEQGKM